MDLVGGVGLNPRLASGTIDDTDLNQTANGQKIASNRTTVVHSRL